MSAKKVYSSWANNLDLLSSDVVSHILTVGGETEALAEASKQFYNWTKPWKTRFLHQQKPTY
jgi:hypothetical protein